MTMLRNVIKGTLFFNVMYYLELKIFITFLGGSLVAFVSPTYCYSVTNPANFLQLNYYFRSGRMQIHCCKQNLKEKIQVEGKYTV